MPYEAHATYTYDERGRFLRDTRDTRPGGEIWTECSYDGDRLQRCVVLDTLVTEVERDAEGHLTALIDQGNRKPITYDAKHRVVAIDEVTFSYDDRGWLATSGLRGYEGAIEHDDQGRVVRIGAVNDELAYDVSYEGPRVTRIHRQPPVGSPHYYDWHDEYFEYDAKRRLIKHHVSNRFENETVSYQYECQ